MQLGLAVNEYAHLRRYAKAFGPEVNIRLHQCAWHELRVVHSRRQVGEAGVGRAQADSLPVLSHPLQREVKDLPVEGAVDQLGAKGPE